MNKKKIALVSLLVVSLFLSVFFLSERETFAKPLRASDTDGTPSSEIIRSISSSHEKVILKVNPFGYLEAGGWESQGMIKRIVAMVEWRTYKDLGAGNIYIGYSFGGDYVESGPFSESDSFTTNQMEIPLNSSSDLSNLKIRFRGEDTDYGPDAVAEVSIRLKVIVYGF
jgi:hypothetical protein